MEAQPWGAMRLAIRNELNLGDQGLVDDAELLCMANRALQMAEGEIHSLNEDYFRTSDKLTLVGGTAEYALPIGIYGTKLRMVLFDDGTKRYEVKRVRPNHLGHVHSDRLRYELDNSSTLGCRMVFRDTPTVDGQFIKRWFIRRVNPIVSDVTVIDLPEFSIFVFNFVKMQCLCKAEGVVSPVLLEMAKTELQMARDLMVGSLSVAVVDEDEGAIDSDMSFYNESIV